MSDTAIFGLHYIEAFTKLVAACDELEVSYALIGGLATGVRSRPRATRDIDLLIDVAQLRLPVLLANLTSRGFNLDERTVIDGFVQNHIAWFDYEGIRIDWLKPVLPAYQHIIDRAEPVQLLGISVRVAMAEGLILTKLLASRPQDIADIAALLAANQGQLDLNWIEQEWLSLFTLDDPRWHQFKKLIAEYYQRKSAT